MKFKIFIISLIIFITFIVNLFNQIIVSNLYNFKTGTSLTSRENWYGMCNDIMDFKIKNLDIIFIGDSHIYSGINLEVLNEKREKLILTCSLPSISFKNNIILFDKLNNKYDPTKIFIGLSPFQFLIADQEKENQRKNQFSKLNYENPYSFQFHSLKKIIQHFTNSVSEKEIALKQTKFLEAQNEKFFDNFNKSIENQIKNVLKKRYNTYQMNDLENNNIINSLCLNYKRYNKKIIFLDVPTPDYFNQNFIFYKKYKDYVNKISQCFTVINSKEITKLNDKRYFFDRYFKFNENKGNNEFLNNNLYDISHLNYAGAYTYTNFIFNKFKKDIKQNFDE